MNCFEVCAFVLREMAKQELQMKFLHYLNTLGKELNISFVLDLVKTESEFEFSAGEHCFFFQNQWEQ